LAATLIRQMPQPPPLKPTSAAAKNRSVAWGMVVANQLALPGLGTVMAGRKIGYVQLAFSIFGVLLTTSFLIWCFPNLGDWFPPPEDDAVVMANFEKWQPWFLIAGSGIVSYFIGWCMALFSSQSIVREQSSEKTRK
jgi:ABC-type uncharacterized transport system permease subunit